MGEAYHPDFYREGNALFSYVPDSGVGRCFYQKSISGFYFGQSYLLSCFSRSRTIYSPLSWFSRNWIVSQSTNVSVPRQQLSGTRLIPAPRSMAMFPFLPWVPLALHPRLFTVGLLQSPIEISHATAYLNITTLFKTSERIESATL